ncbi:cytochrome P450 [Nakamurella antarctica]|uniref:Cytochrome P450 n=1 Tax=Nakamurella antarctica TaxID=1902245 RepID=A0A3G8ZRS8_9ACTN|nr:cytochrome P450 [Nakamurella antarctica]AZI57214.1 cytochrome P450 [Nakamurella antarctica]
MSDEEFVIDNSAFMPLVRNGFDPVPELAQRRREQPVSRLEFPFGIGAWLVAGYADTKTVLGSVDAFSNDFANLTAATGGQATQDQDPGGLGFSDPPKHTRLRKLLTPEFTMRRLQRLIPRIETIVNDRIDALIDARSRTGDAVDLAGLFATPVPSLVISELLDVPVPDREAFARLSADRFDMFGGALSGLDAMTESLQFMTDLVQQQRKSPGDGLLGMLIREHGDEVTDRELAGLADGLLVGGHETTASMIALGALILLQNDDYAELVRTGDSHTVAGIVEEMLRYLSVVQVSFPRFAREDMMIGDTRIAKGDMILCSLSSANRDDDLTTSRTAGPGGSSPLESFDPLRAPTQHFAFGYGFHRCVGAELAKIELRIAYPLLLQRLPGLRLAVRNEEIIFREMSIVYGLESLPVTW